MSSILNDVKQILGLTEDNTAFDLDVMIHINTTLSDLRQMGVGPTAGFEITGSTEEWSQFISSPTQNSVKSYLYLRVKMLFDPPATGFATVSYENQIKQLEWRISLEAETKS